MLRRMAVQSLAVDLTHGQGQENVLSIPTNVSGLSIIKCYQVLSNDGVLEKKSLVVFLQDASSC